MERVQVIAIIVSLIFLAYVMWKIKQGSLREEYAFIWILSNFALIFLSVWRNALEVLARMFGVIAAPNLLFTGAIFAILVYLLHLSLAVSKLHFQNKTLAQEIALLREKVNRKESV